MKPFALLAVSTTAFLLSEVETPTAAEIRVLSVPPLRGAMIELLPQFEKSSGVTVRIEYGTPPQLLDRLRKGEPTDVLIATRQVLAELHKEGKIIGPADVARLGMGMAVRKGAVKPEIASVNAFKRTLLAATSIAYIDPASGAPGGIYLANLFERLGIAADLKPKTRLLGPSGAEAAVAAGEVEIALSQVPVIVDSPGIELVGPLPADIQNYLQFSAGAIAGSNQLEAGKALIQFISSPAAAAAMKDKGFEQTGASKSPGRVEN